MSYTISIHTALNAIVLLKPKRDLCIFMVEKNRQGRFRIAVIHSDFRTYIHISTISEHKSEISRTIRINRSGQFPINVMLILVK